MSPRPHWSYLLSPGSPLTPMPSVAQDTISAPSSLGEPTASSPRPTLSLLSQAGPRKAPGHSLVPPSQPGRWAGPQCPDSYRLLKTLYMPFLSLFPPVSLPFVTARACLSEHKLHTPDFAPSSSSALHSELSYSVQVYTE